MKDYYKMLDDILKEHENYHPLPHQDMDWVANRIDWCWRFRKITKEQMEELADRATKIFERRD